MDFADLGGGDDALWGCGSLVFRTQKLKKVDNMYYCSLTTGKITPNVFWEISYPFTEFLTFKMPL